MTGSRLFQITVVKYDSECSAFMSNQRPIITQRPPIIVRALGFFLRKLPDFWGLKRLDLALQLESIFALGGWTDQIPVNDYVMEVNTSDRIGRAIYLSGTWELPNTIAMESIVCQGATVFDIGANIGYFTLLMASLVGETGGVFAFEPVSTTFHQLSRNVEMNPRLGARIAAHQIALSDCCKSLTMNVATSVNSGASHVVAQLTDDVARMKAGVAYTESVSAVTGDSFWREVRSPSVSIIKMDIEGHELHALRGMRELISASAEIIILVEVRDQYLRAAGGSASDLFAYMNALGMKAYDYSMASKQWNENDIPHDSSLVAFTRIQLDQIESSTFRQ